MTNLLHIGFGHRTDPEEAMVDLHLNIINTRTGETAINDEINIGLPSLLRVAIGVAAVNGLVGYLNGTASSLSDMLTSNNIAAAGRTLGGVAVNGLVGYLNGTASSLSDMLTSNNIVAAGGTLGGVFAACFIGKTAIDEIGKRWVRHRQALFADKAAEWDKVGALFNEDKGVWVVTRGDFDIAKGKAAVMADAANGNAAVLSDAEFRKLEQRVAQAGGTMKTYRIDSEAKKATVMTKVGGKLQSVDGEAAVQVWEDGKLTQEQWYDNGRRMAAPGTGPIDEPKLAFLAERIRTSLRYRDNDNLAGRFRKDLPNFDIALRRLDDGTPAVLVTPEAKGDDGEPEPMVFTQWEGGLDIRLPGQAPVRIDGEDYGEDVRKFLCLPDIVSPLARRLPCQDETTEPAPGRAP